jgi:hypothetical protein
MPLYHFTSQIGETFQCGRREILRLTKLSRQDKSGQGRPNWCARAISNPHQRTSPGNQRTIPAAGVIARWPHDELGISLGFLGQSG